AAPFPHERAALAIGDRPGAVAIPAATAQPTDLSQTFPLITGVVETEKGIAWWRLATSRMIEAISARRSGSILELVEVTAIAAIGMPPSSIKATATAVASAMICPLMTE